MPSNNSKSQQLMQQLIDKGFIPIWNQEGGVELAFFSLYRTLLGDEHLELFRRYFEGAVVEHKKDEHSRIKSEKNKATTRDAFWQLPRQQIRNDFAHYNAIGKSWHIKGENFEQKDRDNGGKRLNLNYLVNSVRSLMAYDRKLKNAVSQSIAKIVEEEGLFIRWKLKDDRLKEAVVAPALTSHLDFLKGDLGLEAGFALPKTSARYTSMVQALFDFGSSGHRTKVSIGGSKPDSVGPLGYPEVSIWDGQGRVPNGMLYTLPSL